MADSLIGSSALEDILELTENQMSGQSTERYAKAAALADDVREMMARRLGDDPDLHLSTLTLVCADTLARSSRSLSALRASVAALETGVMERGVVSMARIRLDKLVEDEDG